MKVIPTGEILGAIVEGIDLARPLDRTEFRTVLQALGEHGVLRFPAQSLDAATLKAFAARFGSLEINVAGAYQEPGHPEVMILSNIVKNGRPIGARDAGQDWHTDMSYSATIAFANVLYALKVPRREGRPLGGTEFANMRAAYVELPDDLRRRLDGIARFQQVLGDDAATPRQLAPAAQPGATPPEAAGAAPDLSDPPDYRRPRAVRQPRLRDPHQRIA
jgi:taurine dioxygenase